MQKINYRSIARQSRDRAAELLDNSADHQVRYAALELRTAMEALVYERVLMLEDELSETDLARWQPRQVFAQLMEIEPSVGHSSQLAFAREGPDGKPIEPLRSLGTDRVISTKELKGNYDRLGSYLHAPTVQQARDGTPVSPDHMRSRCAEILKIIDEVLASTVYAVDFKMTASTQCVECSHAIVFRLPQNGQTRTVNCPRCVASYSLESAPDQGMVLVHERSRTECAYDGCTEERFFWKREVKEGLEWNCSACGQAHVIKLAPFRKPQNGSNG